MRALVLFAVLFALWLGWSGLYKPLLIGLGVLSCLICVWIASRMRSAGTQSLRPGTLLRAFTYMPWLFKEIARANWQVIRIVLSPSLPVHPVMVKVRCRQRTDLGRVVYGNSITLTPGTLTVDVHDDQLTVHALTREGAAQLETGEMDVRVARLEGQP